MAEKFDPAPHDKHAESPREAAASDPVSAAQPSPSKADGDSENSSLWDKVRAVFR